MVFLAHNGLLAKSIAGQKVLVAVEGASRFCHPRAFGMMPFAGAQIVQFDSNGERSLLKAFQLLVETTPLTLHILGHEVVVSTQRLEGDAWDVYVVHPEADLLILATDKVYLEQVLERRARNLDRAALPSDLPEWKYIHTDAAVWALHHFPAAQTKLPPSTTLAPKAFTGISDEQAIGVAFWYDDATKMANLSYLSASHATLQFARDVWNLPEESLEPKIVERTPGVVEISRSMQGGEGDFSFLFLLMGYLGHACYL